MRNESDKDGYSREKEPAIHTPYLVHQYQDQNTSIQII